MKSKIILCCLISTLIYSCVKPKPINLNAQNTFCIYFATLSGSDYPITLWVNDTLIYKGKFIYGKNSSIPNYMLINCFGKQNRTSIRVATAIKDTSFFYKTDTIESLYIWIPDKEFKHFEVVDNNSQRKSDDAGIE